MQDQKKIVVLGSLNHDVFLKMKKLPQVGETITAQNQVMKAFGGKGANQAVACAKVKQDGRSVDVEMLGQGGDDIEGKGYLDYLKQNNVLKDNITVKKDAVTGQAFIMSQTETCENSIILVGGANKAFDKDTEMFELPLEWEESIKSGQILMLQREIPLHVNLEAIRLAKRTRNNEKEQTIILDAGGDDSNISHKLMESVDYLAANETEIKTFLKSIPGHFGNLTEEDKIALRDLKEGDSRIEDYKMINALLQHPKLKILALQGEKGATLMSLLPGKKLNKIHQPAFKFEDFTFRKADLKLVDTTGAGDSFLGGFAMGLVEGKDEKKAMTLGAQMALLTVSKEGASPAMPLRCEVDWLFNNMKN